MHEKTILAEAIAGIEEILSGDLDRISVERVTIGLFFTGAYILKALKAVLHGPLNDIWVGHLSEINPREIAVIAPLMVLMLIIGFWPSWILDVINRTVSALF